MEGAVPPLEPEFALPVLEAPPELLVFRVSKTDIPCGPMVIRTGSPLFDFARITKDSATIFTSVKPALSRSCLIFCAVASCWLDCALDCWFDVEPDVELLPDEDCA